MRFITFLTGVGVALAASITTGLSDSSDMLSVMGQGALEEQHFSVFSNCVQALSSSYRAYVDEGVLVVIPFTKRTIDLDTVDAEMWKCIDSSADTVSLAIESSEFDDPAQEESAHISGIRYADAVQMGLRGQKVIDRVPNSSASNGIQKRDPGYYYAYLSDERTCHGDFNHYYSRRCYTWASAYASTSAGNVDKKKCLKYTIWPHHNCEKGNQRTISIRPQTQCTCQVKPTYSIYGVYC
ncbi:hypothetical protein VHEMI07408 [[Torrubiella] hemipterigena]|uniref:Uncharacterized protein n=1 Tax=[Torrubiella] hemipterigena TaxID=1531966 RepID=A0A0A1TLC2_9HYPO|nr:hypothetical protein VHEMI07408 [[Torrubiella] hemipterigena]